MTGDLREMIKQEFEASLEAFVRSTLPDAYHGMLEMVAYQMGWLEQLGSTRGKRVRPMLVLYTAIGAGGRWQDALPAAWAIELIHNFSLIHDDIEDRSEIRHGNPTIWVKWGVAQAINLGDLLFNLAHCAILELQRNFSAQATLEAANILAQACTRLTGGQFLDLSYENMKKIEMQDYLEMIGGKTAALLSASVELGAICGGASTEARNHLSEFGKYVGLAFQMWDDWLGIWGDAQQTGKSSESDLVSGKKTMPVLFSLEKNRAFARRWNQGSIQPEEVKGLSELLKQEGAQQFTQSQARLFTQRAQSALAQAGLNEDASVLLKDLADSLLDRRF